MYFFVIGFILFSKPNFIFYDEWFDDLKEEELDIKEKKIKTISNIHKFFYRQSNYKVVASEQLTTRHQSKAKRTI